MDLTEFVDNLLSLEEEISSLSEPSNAKMAHMKDRSKSNPIFPYFPGNNALKTVYEERCGTHDESFTFEDS